jgi:hypothetical protein
MSRKFEMMEVMRALGVAPSTASIIANLMNGRVDPDNFRSVEFWPIATLDPPPQYQKILAAVAELLELDMEEVKVTQDLDGEDLWYLSGMGGQPTVTWHKGQFQLREVDL